MRDPYKQEKDQETMRTDYPVPAAAVGSMGRVNGFNTTQMIGRQAIFLLLVLGAAWVLRDRILALDPAEILGTLGRIGPGQWAVALIATGASFWAVGRYDECLHGVLGTRVEKRAARISGASAIAVAQFVGFGVLSGALVRWRLLKDLSLWQALRLSVAVSASFLAGWAILSAAALLYSGAAAQIPRALPLGVLALGALALVVCLIQPRRLPPLPPAAALLRILGLATVDLGFAAAALYVLLPADIALPFPYFASVFLLALGAGLVFGTPGGIGPFEMAMLGFLPMVHQEALLASVLGFRLVYYVVPAAFGLLALAIGLGRPETPDALVLETPDKPHLPSHLETALWNAPRAEVGLVRQGETGVVSQGGMHLAIAGRTGQTLTQIGDPMRADVRIIPLLSHLRRLARQQHLTPLVYKCSATVALAARRRGWAVLPVAEEAWLRPATFTQDGSARRQLRRLIRKADCAGITVREAGRNLPLPQMRAVAEEWAQMQGAERGFSMGRFDDAYVTCQRVFVAWQGTRLAGFITLHESKDEWTLDLMRHRRDAPDGTMHLLIATALDHARQSEVARLSLAAVPRARSDGDNRLIAWVRARVARAAGSEGLRRFKTCFAPHWTPLYATAPGPVSLALGLIEVSREINRAAPRKPRHSSSL